MQQELLRQVKNVPWMQKPNDYETWRSSTYPPRHLITAVFAVVQKDNSFLFVKYNNDPASGRQYDLPGGHIDQGETPEETIVREVLEEACVLVRPVMPVGYYRCFIHGLQKVPDKYPFPESYMAIVYCTIVEERPFIKQHETIDRLYLSLNTLKRMKWREDHIKLLNAFT